MTGSNRADGRSIRGWPRRWLTASLIASALVGAGLLSECRLKAAGGPPLLIAPIMQGIDLCAPAPGAAPFRSESELASYCLATGRSAAGIIEAKLDKLAPPVSPSGRYEVGYALSIPLLRLFVSDSSGWRIDSHAVDRMALTVKETDRPVIVYLFSTHFGVKAPIEEALFEDAANVSVSERGSMPKDKYYGLDIYPWSLASTANGITRYREVAIDHVVDALCRLPAADRRKIRAVTLLGEVHQLYADFERGMGVGGPYIVSDYSQASIRNFRAFLAKRFADIGALNRLTGESYASFDDVDPPARDVRTQPLRRFSEHIDSFAGGTIPLIGWAFDASRGAGQPVWIRIYLDGKQIGRVPARYGRQDVLQAKPAFATADVGWRFDLDFMRLQFGIHRLDFFAEGVDGALASIGSRRISIGDRGRIVSTEMARAELPEASAMPQVEAYVDQPADGASFFYNPLVPLWQAFRNEQVVRYLAHFERRVRASCLGDVDLYTHQITPFTNPSWDGTKFAVDASLRETGTLHLGASLYGEPTYGTSFLDWLATTKHRSYGITEFHPLKAMSPGDVRAMLDRHRRHGARFLSFFLDARPEGARGASERNIFAIDPSNRDFGSNELYSAIHEIVNE